MRLDGQISCATGPQSPYWTADLDTKQQRNVVSAVARGLHSVRSVNAWVLGAINKERTHQPPPHHSAHRDPRTRRQGDVRLLAPPVQEAVLRAREAGQVRLHYFSELCVDALMRLPPRRATEVRAVTAAVIMRLPAYSTAANFCRTACRGHRYAGVLPALVQKTACPNRFTEPSA
jgi:hypothetical protein